MVKNWPGLYRRMDYYDMVVNCKICKVKCLARSYRCGWMCYGCADKHDNSECDKCPVAFVICCKKFINKNKVVFNCGDTGNNLCKTCFT